MLINRFYIYVLSFFFSFLSTFSSYFAQSATADYVLSGKVILNDEPAVGATIKIAELQINAVTDLEGQFSIEDIPNGKYDLEISYIGANKKVQRIEIKDANVQLEIELEEANQELSEVTVTAQSRTTEISSLPMTISSLDAKAVSSQALGAEELLKRSSGVVVRQQGGLGSATSINLNGLTGQAVRIYYDGIPLQVYGGGVQINNIPVDVLERVDVYKGVMPVDVGTDALGGGVNLVLFKSYKEYLRASYSIGSFNTHRATLGGRKNLNDKVSLSLLSFINYSDNDYNMRDVTNLREEIQDNGTAIFREEIIDTRRFHNSHFSAFTEVEASFRDLTWTDELKIAASYSHRNDEIQHGRQLQNLAVGAASRQNESLAGKLDYRKNLLKDKLKVRYFGIVSYTINQNEDSTSTVTNWRGEQFQTINNSTGSEIFAFSTLRRGENLGTAHRLIANYKVTESLHLAVSDFFRYSSIEGADPIGPRLRLGGKLVDPNTIPARLTRNVFGAELKSDLLEEKLTAVTFYKNYTYSAESIDILQRGATVLPIRNVEENSNGYGFALKYQLTPSFFLRGSHEQATRIPTETEIFGDFAATLPNYELKPEQSNNWNVGFNFDKTFSENRFFSLQVDGFVRNQEDLIRLDAFGPENAIFVNEAQVDGRGVELNTKFIPINKLNLTGSFTYQSNEIAEANNQTSVGSQVGTQVPNIPRLFYNLGLSYRFDDLFNSNSSLEASWTYFFIDRFSINEVQNLDNANPAFVIPQQHLHNFDLIYTPSIENLRFSLTIKNVFNNRIFDNFRIPRPGFNCAFKINYSL